MKLILIAGLALSLGACSSGLKEIKPDGDAGSQIVTGEIYPKAPPRPNEGSLWPGDTSQNLLFGDTKARNIGDVVTVLLDENFTSSATATTATSKSSNINLQTGQMLGLPTNLGITNFLGGGNQFDPNLNATTSRSTDGSGTTTREGTMTGTMAAVMAGGLCGLIGVYIVLRGMSYIGHGLSHAIFGGAVVAYVMSWNFYIGAGMWGFISALLINKTVRSTKINADAAIGVITTASFAVGVALISRYRSFTRSFDAALFGNVLGVTTGDLWVIAGVSLMTAVMVFFIYRQLLFTTFDSEVAGIYGVKTAWIDTLFALMLAAALIAALQILGVTLIAAALVIPAITARLLTDSFNRIIFLSVGIGMLTGFVGMYLSFYVDVASGASIVLAQAFLFTVVLAVTSLQQRAQQRMVHTHV